MKWRKFMHDSFYSNNEAWSGVTSVDDLTSDLYYHFTDTNDSKWKLSGDTAATASGLILENSDTTAITVTPGITTMHSGDTIQIVVVNQDLVNVISECTFSSTTAAVASVSSNGLITSLISGTTTIIVRHNDGPTGTTVVTSYWAGPVTLTPSVYNTPPQFVSGFTGTTLQFSLVTDDAHNVTTDASYSVLNGTVASVGLHTGLLTFGSLTNLTASASTVLTATYGNYQPSTTVTNYWKVTALVVTPAALTGTTTGQTQQLTVVDQKGYNVIASCSFVSSAPTVATVSSSGLVTFVGNNGNVHITATYRPIPTVTGTPTTSWVFTAP